MNQEAIRAVAQALLTARTSGQSQDDLPFAHSLQSEAEAYAVQAEVARQLGWFAEGVPLHWKSGGASRSVVLTHAGLPKEGVWASPADASRWPMHGCLVEAEIALRLGREVTPELAASLDYEQAWSLVDAMTVSIELCDSRWRRAGEAPAWLRLADQQSHSALVLGAWVPVQASAPPRDWAAQACRVQIGERPVLEFRGTHTCGDPAWVLPQWLKHATREGQVVPAGRIVTTGSWIGAVAAARGERVSVVFEGIGEAQVQL